MSLVSENIQEGKVWLNSDGKWCKRCPACNREVIGKDGSVTTKFNVSHSIIKGQICHSCIKIGKPTWASLNKEEFGKQHSGENHPMYGRHHTDEVKQKQRERMKGRKLLDVTKEKLKLSNMEAWKNPEIRKKYVNALARTKWLKVRMDVGQEKFIEKWNRLGFNFQPNYQVRVGDDLFYVDGYDVEKNVVLEFDSIYHNRWGQKQKDLERQRKIIKMLNPKRFWRYNAGRRIFIECMTNNFSH